MSWQSTPYTGLTLLAALVALATAIVAWRRRAVRSARELALLMGAIALWAAAYAIELAAPDLATKFSLIKIEYIGVTTAPVFALAFLLTFGGRHAWIRGYRGWLLLVIPVIILGLVWTNEQHGLVYRETTLDHRYGFANLSIHYGPLFWVNAAYAYILLLIGTLFLLSNFLKSKGLHRRQVTILLLATMAPWVGNAIYLTGLNPLPGLDLTPYAFTVTGLAAAWGILRYHLLDILPIAREAIFEELQDLVFVLDHEQRLIDLNPAAAQLIQHEPAEAIGHPLLQVVASPEQFVVLLEASGQTTITLPIEYGGRIHYFDGRVSRLFDRRGHPQGKLVVLHDITRRAEAEHTLRRREAILATVSFSAERLLRATGWEEQIASILAHLGEATLVSRVYVFENQIESTSQITCSQRFEWVAPDTRPQIDNPELQNLPYEDAGFARWLHILPTGQPIHGLIAEFPPSERDILAAQDIRSLAIVPIFVDRAWWGFIGFDDCFNERSWSTAELEALQVAASILGAAIQRERVEQQLQQSAHEMAMLHETSLAITMPHELSKLLELIVERATHLLGGAGGGLYLCDPDRRQVRCVVSFNTPKDFTGTVLAYGEGAAGTVAETGQPLLIDDYRQWSQRAQVYEEDQPFSAIISAPLIWQDQVTGVIHVLHEAGSKRFRPEDLNLLTLFASQAAIAIQNAHHMKEMQVFARRMALLNDITRVAISAPTMQMMLQRLADRLGELFEADGAFITRWDAERNLPYSAAAFGPLREVFISAQVEPGEPTLTAAVLDVGKVVITEDARQSDLLSPRLASMFSIRASIAMPLIAGERKYGAAIVTYNQPRHFERDDIAIAEQAAGQIALALAKAESLDAEQQRTIQLANANSIILALGRVASRVETAFQPEQVMQTVGSELKKLGIDSLVALQQAGKPYLTIHYISMPVEARLEISRITGVNLNGYHITPERFPHYQKVCQRRQAHYSNDTPQVLETILGQAAPDLSTHILGASSITPDTRWIFLPLVAIDQVIGTLWLWGEALEPSTVPAASIFASQVATALENARLYGEIQQLAITDELTGLYNRRGLAEFGRREVERAYRFQRPLSALMLDIDHFKRVNDQYGHPLGDEILRELAALFRENLREIDILTRYGGEEFVILLPESDRLSSKVVAERLRASIEAAPFRTSQGMIGITVSIGLATLEHEHDDLYAMIGRADYALYNAKQGGRNRIEIA